MEILKESHEIASKYLKVGTLANTDYRLLRYVLLQDCSEDCSDSLCSVVSGASSFPTLLYNQVTGEVLGLSPEEAEKLKSLPARYEPWMDQLIRRHFLVADDFDEKSWVDFLRLIAGDILGFKAKGPCYVIMPTSACNARCWYCFENGVPTISMSRETADRTADYIAETCGGNKVKISWYGGEPLLRNDIIERICSRMDIMGVEWESLILTNAYMFDESMIVKARADWHLNKAIIALDGDEDVFNSTKAFVLPERNADYSTENNGASPYRKVLNNIETLLKNDIAVQIRLNLGPDNYDSLISALEETAPRFAQYDHCTLRVGILSVEACRFQEISESDLNRKRVELISAARSLGFSTSNALSPIRIDGCIAERDGHVLINPEGQLSKCYSMIFGNSVGSIWDTPAEIPGKADSKLTIPECDTCVLYPDCYWTSFCDGSCSEKNRNKRILQMQYDMKAIANAHKK